MKKRKKIFILTLEIILLISVFFIFYKFIYTKQKSIISAENSYTSFYEKNKENNFSISKIIAYTSAYGKNKNTNFSQEAWLLEIYQYTDFAIYLSPKSDNIFIKKLWLDELEVTKSPTLGVTSFFYEDALKFGTEYIHSDFPFENSLEFTVLNDKNEDNIIKYNTPIFFADCSTPITLKYVNIVSSNFSLKNTNKLTQNGTLLNNLIKDTSVINANFNFTIHLLDNNDQEYKAVVSFEIPLSEDSKNILVEGNILKIEDNLNINFLKVN